MAEIGQRLGLTKQAVPGILTRHGQNQKPPAQVRCTACDKVILTGFFTLKVNRNVLCLACLEQRPQTPFGQRVKAFRLAAGWIQEQLAERAGLSPSTIGSVERRTCTMPDWPMVAALLRVLGVDLVAHGIVGTGAGK
jgi:DNA-binding XRE family transcriptional regulator